MTVKNANANAERKMGGEYIKGGLIKEREKKKKKQIQLVGGRGCKDNY